MFSPDFYPTPPDVIEQMVVGIDLSGKFILDPSAGSGNIIDYVQIFGANAMCCEINPDLASIVAQKCRFLKSDFLEVTSEEISHIDYIIMNPPFSADEKHILHAWNIAPEGCELISLCNNETLRNNYTRNRETLTRVIEENGHSRNIGNVFSRAQRKTEVEVGLIHLFKPRTSPETEFEGYFDMSEEYERQENGIMTYNEIRDIVNRYVGAVKMYNDVMAAAGKINSLISPIDGFTSIRFGAYYYNNNNFSSIDRDTFKKELQKSAWKTVFAKMNMRKYVTTSVNEELNRFVEKQTKVPFTVGNVYKMAEMIVGTHSGRMDKVLEEAFDSICRLSYDNSEAGEKWKTNSNYKVNRRFIDTYVCDYDLRYTSLLPAYTKIRCGYSDGRMDDIIKALCYMTGKDFDVISSREYFDQQGKKQTKRNDLYYFFNDNKIEWGKWVEWNVFFRVRGYKKGTMHFEFLDENVWMEFNKRVSKIKGWAIPQKTDNKQKGTERTKETTTDLFSM